LGEQAVKRPAAPSSKAQAVMDLIAVRLFMQSMINEARRKPGPSQVMVDQQRGKQQTQVDQRKTKGLARQQV
jgi:hypothetical protein